MLTTFLPVLNYLQHSSGFIKPFNFSLWNIAGAPKVDLGGEVPVDGAGVLPVVVRRGGGFELSQPPPTPPRTCMLLNRGIQTKYAGRIIKNVDS